MKLKEIAHRPPAKGPKAMENRAVPDILMLTNLGRLKKIGPTRVATVRDRDITDIARGNNAKTPPFSWTKA